MGELYAKLSNGRTITVPVERSSREFKKMKKNIFTGETTTNGVRHAALFVRGCDLAPIMGQQSKYATMWEAVKTVRWTGDNMEYRVAYKEEGELQ